MFPQHSLKRAVCALTAIGTAFAFLFPATTARLQDLGIITATPEATGTAQAAAPQQTPDATGVIRITKIKTLTQADLSILTGNVQRPNGIVWHDGKLYTSCTGDWTLYQLDSTNGQTITYIYGVRNAHTLYAENEPNGELVLWVPDFQANQVSRVTRNGVRPVAQGLKGPWGIAELNDDEFLVSNLLGNTIDRVGREGQRDTLVDGLMSPAGIVTNGKTIYVANNGSTRRSVEWYSTDALDGGKPTDGASHILISGLQNTTGLVMGPDNYLYMAYSIGTRGVVGRIDPTTCPDGGCKRDDVEIVALTELAAPLAGLTISPDMRLFVHTMFSPDIYWAQLTAAD